MPLWFAGTGVEDAAAAYDLIGFDPRGSGASEPRLECGSGYDDPARPDYVPANLAEEKAWLERAKDFARKCARGAAARLLPHMTTVDSAHDLEAIRKALGSRRSTSSATPGAPTSAPTTPRSTRTGSAASCSTAWYGPSGVWYQSNLDQNRAFEVRAKDFFAWVARYDAVYGLGSTAADVERRYYEIRAALKTSPAGKVGPSEYDDTFLAAGYTNALWPFLADGLAQAAAGDDGFLQALYQALAEPEGDSGHALYLATSCTDNRWPASWTIWRRDATRLHRTAPFLTWANTWFNAPCLYWPARAGTPLRVSGHHLPPVLLFQSTKDAATPYQGAVEMHRLLPSSRLVVEDGGGNHGVTLAGNECIDRHLSAYLTDGTVPASRPGPDATCAPCPTPSRWG